MSAQPKHAPRTPFLALLIGLFAAGMGLLLLLNTASAANEVARHDLASKGARVEAGLEDLRNRIADSAAPDNLATAAAALGMVAAGNPAFLVVGPDGQITVKGRPGAASEPPVAVAKKPKTTKSPSPTTSATTGRTSKTPGGRSSAAPSTSTTSPSPTNTPTPTLTLGGGDR